jgi:hypothetical protein
MAISATTGSAASTTSAAASLALGAFNLTAGQDVYVAVALDSTSSSVTSITDTKGNTYSQINAVNGTGMRTELWASRGVAAQTSNIITVNVSPNCNIAAAAEEYAGVSALGNNATASDSSTYPRSEVLDQDGNNWVVAALGFACVSGDTQTAQNGTSRQASIPAATAVGVALYDSTMITVGTLVEMTRLSNSRNWASAASELRSGGAAIPAVDYAATAAPSLQQAADIRFLRDLDPTFCTNWSPPSGGGPNWGFVG